MHTSFLYWVIDQSISQGFNEVIKKLWEIIDSSKTDAKEKLKAINLMMQCYKDKFEMIQLEPDLVNKKSYMNRISIFDT